LNESALDALRVLRDRLGKPLIIRSAYHSPVHNCAVGIVKRSKHMEHVAVAMTNRDPVVFEAAAREVGFILPRFYPRSGFTHIDLGPARQ
jgi:zinc D-Ala-D-Ala carboxypeptidase